MENCLKRFMELFEPLSGFLKDKSEMMLLMTIDGQSFFELLSRYF